MLRHNKEIIMTKNIEGKELSSPARAAGLAKAPLVISRISAHL
jgi:hypothetical protein